VVRSIGGHPLGSSQDVRQPQRGVVQSAGNFADFRWARILIGPPFQVVGKGFSDVGEPGKGSGDGSGQEPGNQPGGHDDAYDKNAEPPQRASDLVVDVIFRQRQAHRGHDLVVLYDGCSHVA